MMTMGVAGPNFSERDIKLIAASLDGRADPQRLSLLPRVLREWSRTDLKAHLSRKTHAVMRARLKRLKPLGKRARDLLQALSSLDDHERFRVALELARKPGQSTLEIGQAELERRGARLDEERDFLTNLAESARRATPKRGRGRPRNTTTNFVLQDAAAIYEWLTCTTATRAVDRLDHTETGPFWRFAASLWPVIFGSGDDGLPSAMRNWATARRKYGEESALIANIAMRHPTWGIFDRLRSRVTVGLCS